MFNEFTMEKSEAHVRILVSLMTDTSTSFHYTALCVTEAWAATKTPGKQRWVWGVISARGLRVAVTLNGFISGLRCVHFFPVWWRMNTLLFPLAWPLLEQPIVRVHSWSNATVFALWKSFEGFTGSYIDLDPVHGCAAPSSVNSQMSTGGNPVRDRVLTVALVTPSCWSGLLCGGTVGPWAQA